MAGITDQPFRELCCRLGAGLAVSEMISSNPKVWHTEKSKLRMIHSESAGIRSVQIAGSCADELAFAAQINAENGAQIIDVNMDDGLIDGEAAMVRFLQLMAGEPDISRVPVMIDSSKFHISHDSIYR